MNWRPQRPERCALPGCATPRPRFCRGAKEGRRAAPEYIRARARAESLTMKWQQFKAAAPQLGGPGPGRIRRTAPGILGTLRNDGWPRISPCEVYFFDGEMLLGMMPRSKKVDRPAPRPAHHGRERPGEPRAPTGRREALRPRAGRSSTNGSTGLADAQEALIDWRPPAHAPVFAVDIESASYISFGDGRRLLRWQAGSGEEELTHPERTLEASGEGGTSIERG